MARGRDRSPGPTAFRSRKALFYSLALGALVFIVTGLTFMHGTNRDSPEAQKLNVYKATTPLHAVKSWASIPTASLEERPAPDLYNIPPYQENLLPLLDISANEEQDVIYQLVEPPRASHDALAASSPEPEVNNLGVNDNVLERNEDVLFPTSPVTAELHRGPAPEYAVVPFNTTEEPDGVVRAGSDGALQAVLKRPDSSGENHASNLVLLPDGSLICAWFHGLEGEDNVAIVTSILRWGGNRWSSPRVVVRRSGYSAQNPVLWRNDDLHELMLMHTLQAAGQGQGTSEVWALTSSDWGLTWSAPRQLFSQERGVFIRNPPIRSRRVRGEWIMGVYYTPSGQKGFQDQYSVARWTRDGGRTWNGPPFAQISHPGEALVQPSIVYIPPAGVAAKGGAPGRPARGKGRGDQGEGGILVAFLRDRNAFRVYRSVSWNYGRSWSVGSATHLPNNNKAVQAATLPNGNLVMVFGNQRSHRGRPCLSLGLSVDGGDSFPYIRDLQEFFHRKPAEYSYGSIAISWRGCSPSPPLNAAPGIHLTYTYSLLNARRVAIRYMYGESNS
eukprot:jgi/Mesvir1/9866/Mv22404-RA.1